MQQLIYHMEWFDCKKIDCVMIGSRAQLKTRLILRTK